MRVAAAALAGALLAAVPLSGARGASGGNPAATPTASPAAAPSGKGPVEWLWVEGTITAGTAAYLKRGIEQAEKNDAAAVVIQLDTPGGVLDATWDIVESELNATVPVVVWVGPRGAHAGSAGVFITLASNIAVMAPATRIGAAHPVGLGEPDPGAPALPGSSPAASPAASPAGTPAAARTPFVFTGDKAHLAQKIENDTIAWVTSIAQERGRNVEWAKKAVLDSDAIVADEAVKRGVADMIAADREQVLSGIDGRTVKTAAGPVTLATESASVDELRMSAREQVFVWLANPTLIAILLGIVVLGFYTEFQHPGAIFPAVVGGIALLGLLVGVQAVPVHYAALLLILIGFACFILEIKVTSYGLLTLGGVAGVGLGLYLLVDRSKFTVPVSWGIAAPALASIVLIVVFITWIAARAMSATPLGDAREFVGRVVRAHTALSPNGTVTLDGTFWRAVSTRPVDAGTSVRIVSSKGLTLFVEPAPPDAAPPESFVQGGSAT